MFEKSSQTVESFIAKLEEQRKNNEQFIEKREERANEARKRNQRIIDDPKTSPVERLRALIMDALESDEIVQLHRYQVNLVSNEFFASSVRLFQEEVAYELNMLNAKVLLQKPKSEELEKYAKIEKQLQNMKRRMNTEWKPLMDKLRMEIERRNKFLNENR